MLAETFLKRIVNLNLLIDCKLEQIKELRHSLTSIGGVSGGDRVQTTLNPDKWTMKIAKIVDLENEINAEIDKYVDYKRKARELIETLDDDLEKVVLYKRYFENKSYEQIAEECFFSLRQVFYIRKNALTKLDKLCTLLH